MLNLGPFDHFTMGLDADSCAGLGRSGVRGVIWQIARTSPRGCCTDQSKFLAHQWFHFDKFVRSPDTEKKRKLTFIPK